MHDKIIVKINEGGIVEHIHDETFTKEIGLKNEDIISIKRASHVEPDQSDLGTWYVDLSPVDGPRMDGFKTRTEALIAEVKWLNENYYKKN